MTIRDLPKTERREEIVKEAYRMADSGRYTSWHQIEIDLRRDGLTEARSLLDHRDIRRDLDEHCAAAHAAIGQKAA